MSQSEKHMKMPFIVERSTKCCFQLGDQPHNKDLGRRDPCSKQKDLPMVRSPFLRETLQNLFLPSQQNTTSSYSKQPKHICISKQISIQNYHNYLNKADQIFNKLRLKSQTESQKQYFIQKTQQNYTQQNTVKEEPFKNQKKSEASQISTFKSNQKDKIKSEQALITKYRQRDQKSKKKSQSIYQKLKNISIKQLNQAVFHTNLSKVSGHVGGSNFQNRFSVQKKPFFMVKHEQSQMYREEKQLIKRIKSISNYEITKKLSNSMQVKNYGRFFPIIKFQH